MTEVINPYQFACVVMGTPRLRRLARVLERFVHVIGGLIIPIGQDNGDWGCFIFGRRGQDFAHQIPQKPRKCIEVYFILERFKLMAWKQGHRALKRLDSDILRRNAIGWLGIFAESYIMRC
ncbi:MAG: hypothetical protein HKN18_02875 [Silicimonas sp.]|nr:hypothetical protein [Silicimonas sp.]